MTRLDFLTRGMWMSLLVACTAGCGGAGEDARLADGSVDFGSGIVMTAEGQIIVNPPRATAER